jgi:hypothetical protein
LLVPPRQNCAGKPTCRCRGREALMQRRMRGEASWAIARLAAVIGRRPHIMPCTPTRSALEAATVLAARRPPRRSTGSVSTSSSLSCWAVTTSSASHALQRSSGVTSYHRWRQPDRAAQIAPSAAPAVPVQQ